MPEPKTRRTPVDPAAFLAGLPEGRRAEAVALCALMSEATGEEPVMWGASIIGFGEATTGTGTWPAVSFSPRAKMLVVYLMDGFEEATRQADLERLGPHTLGRACLNVKRLDAVDPGVLSRIVAASYSASRSPAS